VIVIVTMVMTVSMTMTITMIVAMIMIGMMIGMRHRRIEGMGIFRAGLRRLRFIARLSPATALQMKIWCRQQFGKFRFAAVGTIDRRGRVDFLQFIEMIATGTALISKNRHVFVLFPVCAGSE